MVALTLNDYAQSPKALVAGVAKVLQEASPLMDTVPFVDTGSLSINVVRESTRPTAAWRKIGAAHGSSKGSTDMVEEVAFSLGNSIDVDKVYVRAKNVLYDARALQARQTLESVAFEFNDAFINGDPTVTPDRPTGLYFRVTNDMPASQRIDAGGIDISPDTADASAAYKFFDALDQLIYAMPGHTASALVCNDTVLMRYWSLARKSGLLATTKDNLDREFYTYKGAKIIDAGFKVNSVAKVMGNVETAAGLLTGSTRSSIFAVKFGPEYLTGWQQYSLDVQDLGLLDDGVTYRSLVDWMVGLAVTHPQSVARLYNIVAA